MFFMLALLFAVIAGCESETKGGEESAENTTENTESAEATENAEAGGAYMVDVGQSVIKWTGSKTEEDDTHTGEIKLKDGKLEMDAEGNLTGGSFSIDMLSLINTDLEGGMKGDIETHLKSADFFDVDQFGTATFMIKEAKADAEAGGYMITGEMKVKDLSQEITFMAMVAEEGGKVQANADIELTQEDMGLQAFPAKIMLSVNLMANKG